MEDTEIRAMKWASNNKDDPKVPAVLNKLGLDNSDLRAFSYANANPNDERSAAVLNKISDKISNKPGMISNALSTVGEYAGKALHYLGEKEQQYGGGTAVRAGLNELTKPGVSLGDSLSNAKSAVAANYGKTPDQVPNELGQNLGLSTAPNTATFKPTPDQERLGMKGFTRSSQSDAETANAVSDLVSDPVNFLGFGLAKTGQVVKNLGKAAARFTFGVENTPNIGKVLEASKTLGVEPTAGQLTNNKFVRNQENILSKSEGFLGGSDLRKNIKNTESKLAETANNLTEGAGVQTANEASTQFAKTFQDSLAEKLKSAEGTYGAWQDALKQTGLPASTDGIKAGLDKMAKELEYSKAARAAVEEAKANVGNLKTIDDIKRYRTIVGNELANAEDGNLKLLYSNLYGNLTSARSDSLKLLAKQTQTKEFAEQAIKQLSEADKQYADVSKQALNAFGETKSNLGPKGLSKQFFKENSPEQAAAKALDLKDPTRIAQFSKDFPEAFNVLKERKIKELMDMSQDAGAISPSKLAKNLSKLPEESRNLIFGEGASDKIDAMKYFIETKPKDINPSGTGLFLAFKNVANIPGHAESALRGSIYNLLTKPPAASPSFIRPISWGGIAIPKLQNDYNGIQIPGRGMIPPPRR